MYEQQLEKSESMEKWEIEKEKREYSYTVKEKVGRRLEEKRLEKWPHILVLENVCIENRGKT